MFLIDCKQTYHPNYEEACCLKHLIITSEYSEIQMMDARYSKLFFKTLNHNFKLNEIKYEKIGFDLLKLFLEVLSKYISFFFQANKTEYAKILIKIALNACTISDYSEHHEILIRKMAITNNLVCIYERYIPTYLYINKSIFI